MGLDFKPQRDVILAFTTPIAQIALGGAEEINPQLGRTVLDAEAASPTARRPEGGWRSDGDLLTWPQPEVARLGEAFRDAVNHMVALTTRTTRFEGEVLVNAWARVHRAGSYERVHSSPGSHWSGFYVVDPGTEAAGWPESGTVEFQDPRGPLAVSPGPENPFGRAYTISPPAGTLVIFPGWLQRWMSPYHGERERILVAFDARMRNLRMLDEGAERQTASGQTLQ